MRERIWLMSIMAIVMIVGTVSALPEILDGFNAKYDTVGTKLDTCDTCHISGKPQHNACDDVCHIPNKPQKESDNLNPYGVSIKNSLKMNISQAFTTIENLDSDGDKFSNIDEIHNLTFPGDKKDSPKKIKNIFGPLIIYDSK